ncbi:hypothetical protein QYM36_013156, partial [Artemia franciscana]
MHLGKLLSPLEESKKEAQYFFTQESVTTIVNMIEKADVKKLLCIGAPRIHEKVVNCKSNIQSVLLDIDERYRSFYEPPTYLPFNMFNHHLFDGKEAVSVLRKFLECQENEVVGKKGRKHGSPVRIFTNVSPSLIPLPAEEGYRFCSLCRRWVSQENKHCSLCNSCTSKGKQISKRKPLDDLIGSSKKECTSAKKKRKLSITHCGSE